MYRHLHPELREPESLLPLSKGSPHGSRYVTHPTIHTVSSIFSETTLTIQTSSNS